MTKKVRVPRDECIFDHEGFKMRSAAVCVKDETESEVLLVSSLTKPNSWIVPAGKIQIGEEAGACAIREAMEEGGVCGRLGRYLGTYDEHQPMTNKNDLTSPVKKRTSVFVLYVERLADDYEERDSRTRQWFPISEALKHLNSYKAHQADYLKALQKGPCLKPSMVVEKKPPPPPPLIQFIQEVSNRSDDHHVNDVT